MWLLYMLRHRLFQMYMNLHLLKWRKLLHYLIRKLHMDTNMDTKDTSGRNKEGAAKYRVCLYKFFLAGPLLRRR
jgi:hypothetical protein